jgi:hypothetical protein
MNGHLDPHAQWPTADILSQHSVNLSRAGVGSVIRPPQQRTA